MLDFLWLEKTLIVAVATTAIVYSVGAVWFDDISDPLVFGGLFIWIFFVMVWSAFSAVRHADSLAELLGEPYGTLILTISVTVIEISVISAVMLTGRAEPALARDTMMAVMMLVLNGMVGLSLLIGGLKHREQSFNLDSARAFLSVLITLATLSLVVPRYTISTSDATLTHVQSVLFCIMTLVLYGTFLAIQTTRHRGFFLEPQDAGDEHRPPEHGKHPDGLETQSILYHAIFLILTLLPIVLLSKKLAIVLDAGVVALGAPSALGGVVIAVLILAPEGLAAFHAAARNHLQRAVNISLGSALATISLTVPAVIGVGLLTGTSVLLGLDGSEAVLLLLTLILSLVTFGGRTNVLLGTVHLVVLAVYVVLIFDP